MAKRILIISPNPENYAPGQRLKYEQYFESWIENGWNIDVEPFFSDAFQQIVYKDGNILKKIYYTLTAYCRRIALLPKVSEYDIVYIFLWVTPFGAPVFEWLYTKAAKKLVFDIDDLVFLKNNPHEKKYLSWIKGKEKPIFLMKHADYVITCTPYLDKFVRQYNAKTTDISSTVDTEKRYQAVNDYSNDDKIILGWSGSHSTSKYLYLLQNVLLKLKEQVDFKLLVMGDDSFHIDGLDVEAIKWSEEKEIPQLQRMDIGLYPLPLNEEWVLGKSGLKAIQYCALGIPSIATDVGCNDRVILNNETGYLIKTEEEWLQKLLLLIQDNQLRKKIGTAARTYISDNYSIHANKETYLKILNEVAGY